MSTPLVSVVMPAFDSAPWIGEAIASVRAQSMPDWELLIVDDASRDGTVAAAQAAAGEDLGGRIQLHQQAVSGGPATARNHALRLARGRWIAFLDSDDRWRPLKLERQLAFAARERAALTYHAYELMDEDGTPLGKRSPAPPRVDRHALLPFNVIGCLAGMYDREAVGLVLMPPLQKRQDHGLWLRVLRKVPWGHGLDEDLADYRVRRGSVSRNKFSAAAWQWRLYRHPEGEAMGLLPAAWTMARYACGHLLGRRFAATSPQAG